MSIKRYVLGLDVSTSCTGFCILDRDIVPDGTGNQIIELDRIEFKKCKTLWEKADLITARLKLLADKHGNGLVSNFQVAVEEPLLGFRPGLSSATTIASLLRFNGIVSYAARNIFKTEPIYLSAAHARKLCGVKFQKLAAVKISQKEQVFNHMKQHDLSHVVWPLKKSGKIVEWAMDATDSYCIARAAVIEIPISEQQPKN